MPLRAARCHKSPFSRARRRRGWKGSVVEKYSDVAYSAKHEPVSAHTLLRTVSKVGEYSLLAVRIRKVSKQKRIYQITASNDPFARSNILFVPSIRNL